MLRLHMCLGKWVGKRGKWVWKGFKRLTPSPGRSSDSLDEAGEGDLGRLVPSVVTAVAGVAGYHFVSCRDVKIGLAAKGSTAM